MNPLRPGPALVPADLGLDLDQDSEGFNDEATAVETESQDDFARKAAALVAEVTQPAVTYTLLRKAGILYCRVHVVGPSGVRTQLYQMPWLRGTP